MLSIGDRKNSLFIEAYLNPDTHKKLYERIESYFKKNHLMFHLLPKPENCFTSTSFIHVTAPGFLPSHQEIWSGVDGELSAGIKDHTELMLRYASEIVEKFCELKRQGLSDDNIFAAIDKDIINSKSPTTFAEGVLSTQRRLEFSQPIKFSLRIVDEFELLPRETFGALGKNHLAEELGKALAERYPTGRTIVTRQEDDVKMDIALAVSLELNARYPDLLSKKQINTLANATAKAVTPMLLGKKQENHL